MNGLKAGERDARRMRIARARRCKKMAHGIRPARADGLLVFVVAMRRGSRPPRKARQEPTLLRARWSLRAHVVGSGVAGVGSVIVIITRQGGDD